MNIKIRYLKHYAFAYGNPVLLSNLRPTRTMTSIRHEEEEEEETILLLLHATTSRRATNNRCCKA
jgi:hypothetical protein